jgi:hypothetical protein
MKTVLKVALVLFVLAVLMLSGAQAGASYGGEYLISMEGDEYVLSSFQNSSAEPIIKSSDFTEVVNFINSVGGTINLVFSNINVSRNVEFAGNITFSGSLSLADECLFTIVKGEALFSSFSLKMSGGYLRIKEGSLTVENSEIISSSSSAVRMDYASAARLVLNSGSIRCDSEKKPALIINYGTAYICGGSVKNGLGDAIHNNASLNICGEPEISGLDFGIVTSSPISLSYNGSFIGRHVRVKYQGLFDSGSISCVFYSASPEAVEFISLYDKNGNAEQVKYFDSFNGIAERSFGAVYKPYEINFYFEDSVVSKTEALRGDKITAAPTPDKLGYVFDCWSYMGNAYDFAKPICADMDLYAEYKLKSPTFFVPSLEFTYDSNEHEFGIEDISHPLLSSAIISYTWYKDGEFVSNAGPLIKLKAVSESGMYACKIDFTVNTDTATVYTPKTEVKISKAVINIPTILSKPYNGEHQQADIYSTSQYTVESGGGSLVGKYPIKLTVKDYSNYEFYGGAQTVYTEFAITKTENLWVDEIRINNIYEGESISPTASSRFGEAVFTYSKSKTGQYTAAPPTEPGVYYCIASVSETDNYYSLCSEPVEFMIIAEEVLGISVNTPPDKTEYSAFEKFNSTGFTALATYNSGRTEVIEAERISYTYQIADSFRYGDNSIIAEYLGLSLAVPVTVKKAEYNISSLKFFDTETVYNGELQAINYTGSLPWGEDGIPLECTVSGGGIDAGVYTVTLSFRSASKNYILPADIKAELTVLPFATSVVFENLSFIYDGSAKCPKAYCIDIYGRKIELEVSGVHSLAGEYEARASISNSNYTLLNSTVRYVIEKAEYDLSGVFWTEADFVYDATAKVVEIGGLPDGITVLGYSDNKGVNAGKYTARVTLGYDEENYNPPQELSYIWSIKKAEYDLSGISFSDNQAVYNGQAHYPIFEGTMPVGLDGIMLEYSYSTGVINVNEGKKAVEIAFSTKSKNYNLPENMSAIVEIIPLGIEVEWIGDNFTYDTQAHAPKASAPECAVSVIGSAVDAGSYTATAVAVNPNYCIINSTKDFIINKAANSWIDGLSVFDIFEGRVPTPTAKAFAGDCEYLYYADEECKNLISEPSAVGIYYVCAYSAGSNNYHPIKSEALKFEIIKIMPVGMQLTAAKGEYPPPPAGRSAALPRLQRSLQLR